MFHRSPSSGYGNLFVNDVGINDGDLNNPEENFSPPFHRFVEKAVIRGKLVQLVHTQHVLVVVIDGYRLQLCLTRSVRSLYV